MKSTRSTFLLVLLFTSISSIAQDFKITGKIVDAVSGEPLTGVAVYISGTSTGVVSGLDGSYSITYTPEFKAPLVFSYLGYEKIQIENPLNINLSLIKMTEQTNTLEAVLINPDPWDRAYKERIFLKYFVGAGVLDHVKVSNLKDVQLRFNTTTKQLTAASNNPIILINDRLGYLINYDLSEFEVNFKFLENTTGIEKNFRLEHAPERYLAENTFGLGTSFYQEKAGKKPTERQRERRRRKAYDRSQLKLYRAIISNNLKDSKFDLFYRGFRVNPEDHIRVTKASEEINKITFRHLKYSVKDRDGNQTDLHLKDHVIYIDLFGNNLSPRSLFLSGYIADLGVGGMMPLDYNLNQE